MPAAAILPVKRFERAKQRLDPTLTAGSRRALASAMLGDVLGALKHSSLIDIVLVVSGEPTASELATEPDVLLLRDETEKGQSQAALNGLARASALGYEHALLVPGDCPLIDPLELDNLIATSGVAGRDVAIVPDRHGKGTNALLLDPGGPFQPQFGPGSLAKHTAQAEQKGLACAVERVPSLELDVDTGEDLAELISALSRVHGRAPRTRGVLRQIQRSLPRPPIPA